MFSKEYRIHYSKTWSLAYPLVIGQAGHMLTNIADQMMVGRLGSTELAAASIANIVFILVFVFGIGLASGITALSGKAYGEKDFTMLKDIFSTGLKTNVLIGILLTMILIAMRGVFPYLGQEPLVATLAQPYYDILVFSMLPYMVFLHYKQFVDGLAKTKPGMIVLLVCNAVNIVLNYGFIYGKLWLPELGLNGAAVATTISRVLMALSFVFLMYYSTSLRKYVIGFVRSKFHYERFLEILKIGVPIGFQIVLEVAAFVIGAIMTGWLGAKQLAAYQIVIGLASLTFLMASGVASTATVRISNYLGERKFRRLEIAGYSAIIMSVAFMAFSGVLFYIGRNYLPTLYINEPDVVAIASKLMIIAALFQVMDGTQVTAIGALRGLQDVNAPTYIALFSYWIVSLPICYYLAIYLNIGVEGIWYGYLVGLTVAAVTLTWRYIYKSKRIELF